jgi:nucleoid-associated protein YgaU
MSQSILQNALIAAAIGGVGLASYLIVDRHVSQEVAEVSSQPEAPPAAPEPLAPAAPSFDVVRVTPEGSAVVAGRAEPGATVTIRADGTAIAEVEAGPTGEFVTLFQTPPSAAPQTLTLTADDLPSEQSLLILPPAPPVATAPEAPAAAPSPLAAAAVEPAVGTGTAAPADPAVEGPPEEIAAAAGAPAAGQEPSAADAEEAATATDAAPAQVAATAIIGPDAVPQVTPTADAAIASRRGVTLASISYADEGLVTLAGLGTAGSALRVYVDDAFARDGVVEEDGRWALQLDGVSAGVYRLRVDEVRSDGTVTSRVETPFQRDFPALPPGETDAATAPVSVTVQPGNNLWTLARIHYGEGILYTQIFTANTDLIGDPDLIYPGQILALPEVHGDAPANLSASGLPLPRP